MRHPVLASVAASFVVVLVLLAGPAAGSPAPGGGSIRLRFDAGTEHEYQVRLDDARRSEGAAPLAVAADLVDAARRHAAQMADQQRTFDDPQLGERVAGWVEVGAVVGGGTDVDDVHADWLASEVHRTEVLHGAYSQVGTGVAWGQDGRMYVSHVFRAPDPSYTPPAHAETDAEIAEARRSGTPGASFGAVPAAHEGLAGADAVAGDPGTRDGTSIRKVLAGSAGADPALGTGTASAGPPATDRTGQRVLSADELSAARTAAETADAVAMLLALVAGISLIASSTLLVRVAATHRR